MNILLRSAALLALASLALAASAQNLVVNPGFETNGGTFSHVIAGWTVSQPNNGFEVYDDAHTGNYNAEFGTNSGTDTISQSIPTVAGRSYTVSFWLKQYRGDMRGTKSFASAFGSGSFALTGANLGLPDTYAQFSYTGVAASTSTTLSLTVGNDQDYYELDDVSVTLQAVPEPSSLAALGLGAVALLKRRKRA